VGAGRGLKRLSLRTLEEIELDAAPASPNGIPGLPAGTTLRDALSLMLTSGSRVCLVRGADGRPAGSITLDRIAELMAER
jgi:CBS domain-containing protein